MQNNGWIKLHRRLLEWEWYKDDYTFKLFITLLLQANHQAGNWRGMAINRGELVSSQSQLTRQLTGNQHALQQTRTAIHRLKLTGELTIKTTNKFSLFKLNNYELYQTDNKQTNRQLTGKTLKTNRLTNNKQEDKECIKNEKNISKDIQASPEPYLLINYLIQSLKEYNSLTSLDDTIGKNRQFAYLLIKHKITPEFKTPPTDDQIKQAFDKILVKADNFHKKNMTSFKYIYYNFNKIWN